MAILYVGIDLAKNVFAVHGVDEHGKAALVRASVPRAKVHALIASLAPCTIGMEACSGAHHWARLFAALGHTVRLMAPKFVAPYRLSGKRGKTDAADAAAICEALQRPHMRFVPVKSLEQQATLTLHRVRQGFVEQRTAIINRIRGLLSEFGIVLPLKASTVRHQAGVALEDLPGWANLAIGDCLSELHRLDERIVQYDITGHGGQNVGWLDVPVHERESTQQLARYVIGHDLQAADPQTIPGPERKAVGLGAQFRNLCDHLLIALDREVGRIPRVGPGHLEAIAERNLQAKLVSTTVASQSSNEGHSGVREYGIRRFHRHHIHRSVVRRDSEGDQNVSGDQLLRQSFEWIPRRLERFADVGANSRWGSAVATRELARRRNGCYCRDAQQGNERSDGMAAHEGA